MPSFVTGKETYRDSWAVCILIGAIGVYAYFLAFMYTVSMSWVLIQCLRKPIMEREVQESTGWYHILSHIASLLLVVAILAGSGMGNSVMETCFVQSQSWAEYSLHRVLLLLPLTTLTPLIVWAMIYALCRYHQKYKKFITRHTAVVVMFSFAWFPVALLHFWNANFINGNPPLVLKDVIYRQIACILGALSGFLTFTVQGILIFLQRNISPLGTVDVLQDAALESLAISREV